MVVLARVSHLGRRFGLDRGFLGSAATVSVFYTAARALGFLFTLLLARALGPAELGVLAYGIAVSEVLSTLIVNSPVGLARFLSIAQSRAEQGTELSSGLVVVGLVMLVSCGLSFVALTAWQGWSQWMVAAVLANLAGKTIFHIYWQAQRGLLRFLHLGIFYVGSNLIMVLGALAALGAGLRSPVVMLFIYGLSVVPAIVAVELLAPSGVSFSPRLIRLIRVKASLFFAIPMMFHSAASSIWFASDTILVQHFLGVAATGNYGVAKSLVQIFALVPSGITYVLLPTVANRQAHESRGYLWQAAVITLVAGGGLLLAVLLMGEQIVSLLFGRGFRTASLALVGLAPGMALYGLVNIFQSYWTGRGRPSLMALNIGIGALTSIGAEVLFIPKFGLLGAGLGFALGAVVQMATLGAATFYLFRRARAQ
jgi:O-antigen/teichoic acid export membrane protein